MKDLFRTLRPVLLAAALACLVIATLVGFGLVTVGYGMRPVLTCAWGFWGVACYVGSKVAGELAA